MGCGAWLHRRNGIGEVLRVVVPLVRVPAAVRVEAPAEAQEVLRRQRAPAADLALQLLQTPGERGPVGEERGRTLSDSGGFLMVV